MVSKLEARLAAEDRKRIERLQFAMWALDAWAGDPVDNSMELVGLSLKAPSFPGGDWMITLRVAAGDGGRYVAFESGDSVATALVRLVNRVEQESVSWKEDNYEKR